MNITVFGTGKLGLCFALLLEESGHNVLGIDIDEDYIESLNNKTLTSSEPMVEVLLKRSKNFRATSSSLKGVNHSDILYIFVATPSLDDNTYDHSQIEKIVSYLLDNNIKDKSLIIGCTVMPGYCRDLAERLKHLNIRVSYNPEFIAQGDILHGLENPDFVLIGEHDSIEGQMIEDIYHSFIDEPVIKRMSTISAEICKLSLNCYITTKIAFANSIGDLAILSGASKEDILDAIGADSRVGSKCLKYGFGFGGPCFPRDNKALLKYAESKGTDIPISKASDESNNQHHNFLFQQSKDKETIFYSLSYKPNSPILTESQQLRLCSDLIDAGCKVKIVEKRKEVIDNLPDKIKNHLHD